MSILFNYNMEKLKEIARNRKIRGFSRLKKEELVNKIEESLLDEDFAYEFFKKIDKIEFDTFKKSIDTNNKICDKLIFASDLEDYGYIYVTEIGRASCRERV